MKFEIIYTEQLGLTVIIKLLISKISVSHKGQANSRTYMMMNQEREDVSMVEGELPV